MVTHAHNSMDEAGNVLRYANSAGILIQNIHGVFYHSPQPEGAVQRDLVGVSDIKESKHFTWTCLVGIKKQEDAQAAFMEIYRRHNSPMKGKSGTRGKDKGGRQKNPLKNAEGQGGSQTKGESEKAGKRQKGMVEELAKGYTPTAPSVEQMLDAELAAERAIILALIPLKTWQRVATLNAVAARFQLTYDDVPQG